MRFKNLDLVIVMVLVGINIVLVQFPNRPLLIGIVCALPLTLFLPGYALTQTLFRRRVPEQTPEASNRLIRRPNLILGRSISNVDKILLSFGLSLALDVLIGFGLNLFSIGLVGFSWVISLGLITVVFVALTIFFRSQDLPQNPARAVASRVHITPQDSFLFGMAVLIVALAVWLSLVRPLSPTPSFTQLWLLQDKQANKACTVSIGVQSFETTAETYQVVMLVNKASTHVWSSISLQPQQKWTQIVPVTPGAAGSLFIEALLYRADKPGTEYRTTHVTFHALSGQSDGSAPYHCSLTA